MLFKKAILAVVPFTLLLSASASAETVAVHYVKAKKHVVVYAIPSNKKDSFSCKVHRSTINRGKSWAICSAKDFAGTRFACKSSDAGFISQVREIGNAKGVTVYSKSRGAMRKKNSKRAVRAGHYYACSQIELTYGI